MAAGRGSAAHHEAAEGTETAGAAGASGNAAQGVIGIGVAGTTIGMAGVRGIMIGGGMTGEAGGTEAVWVGEGGGGGAWWLNSAAVACPDCLFHAVWEPDVQG